MSYQADRIIGRLLVWSFVWLTENLQTDECYIRLVSIGMAPEDDNKSDQLTHLNPDTRR